MSGTAEGGTRAGGLPAGVAPGRDYDILPAGGGLCRSGPRDRTAVCAGVYGSGDGDPTDRKLHGFMTVPQRRFPARGHRALPTSTQVRRLRRRDYSCPARARECGHGSRSEQSQALSVTCRRWVRGYWSGGGTFECNHRLEPVKMALGMHRIRGSGRATPTRGCWLFQWGCGPSRSRGMRSPAGTCIGS